MSKLNDMLSGMKKGQLGIIEFKYFMVGLVIGLIVIIILTGLGNSGTIPFKMPLVCG